MPDAQQPQEIHIHNDATATGPLGAIPAVVKTFAGIPTDKAIVWAVILAVLAVILVLIAVVAATIYSMMWLQPAAAAQQRAETERQQQLWHNDGLRIQQEEAERSRDMMTREGALNRQAREASDRMQAENTKALTAEMARLEQTIKKLIDKQDETGYLIRP